MRVSLVGYSNPLAPIIIYKKPDEPFEKSVYMDLGYTNYDLWYTIFDVGYDGGYGKTPDASGLLEYLPDSYDFGMDIYNFGTEEAIYLRLYVQ